jgi:nucleotide-binding universal stress UspA family protein
VSVLQLLRVWGSGLGLPHPGLKPNVRERQVADSSVRAAVAYLDRRGVEISGKHVIPTRNPAKAVLREADRIGAHLVVMGAPARRRIGDLTWANEPHRVARQAARRARPEVRLVLPA